MQGATPYQVDNAILVGMPMGLIPDERPRRSGSGWRARKPNGVKPEEVPMARVADKLQEMDRYGQKPAEATTSIQGSRAGQADPEVVQMVEKLC